jgi:hypothetical protein
MKRLSLYFILITVGVCLFWDFNYRWQNGWWRSDIHSDGYGYYAYLPCIFIYHKFDYDRLIQAEKQARPEVSDFEASYSFPYADNGQHTDKYCAGEALLITPFFLLAYFLSYLTDHSTNGLSIFFQFSVSIAALVYLTIGIVYVRRLLKLHGIPEYLILFIQFVLVFGTNLLYYCTIEPSMSHVYSFCAMAAFLFYAKSLLNDFNRKDALFMGFALGILLLIRPTNIISLAFFPFLAGSADTFLKFCKQLFKPINLSLCSLPTITIGSIQLVLWYLQTGHFFYWGYGGERFYFAHPKFFSILFSFQAGWFIYTPVMFIGLLVGLGIEIRRSFFGFISFIAFFTLLTYVLSSWHCWHYGGYGLRTYIDYYAAFSILPAIAFNAVKPWLRATLALICIFLVYVNITQTKQTFYSIMDNHYMDAHGYWKIFLRTDPKYVNILSQNTPDSIKVYNNLVFRSDFENNSWGNDNSINDTYSLLSRHSAFVGKNVNYSPTLRIAANELPKDSLHYLYVDLWAYMNDTNNNAALIISVETKDGDSYFYSSTLLKSRIHNIAEWTQVTRLVTLPKFKSTDNVIKVYEFATTGDTYIDNVNISFGTRKNLSP